MMNGKSRHLPEISITEEMLYISGNKQGLRRVIQNVIKNGLDHGEKNISISLPVRIIMPCLKSAIIRNILKILT